MSNKKEAIPVQILIKPIFSIFLPQRDTEIPVDCDELLTWISNLPQDVLDNFTDETIKDIIDKIFYYASMLHVPSLQCFSAISCRAPKEIVKNLCSVFPVALYKYIRTNDSIIGRKEIKGTSIKLPDVSVNTTLSMHFIDEPTFESTMSTTLLYLFDPVKEVGKLIPDDLKSIVECIAVALTTQPGLQESILSFFNTIVENQEGAFFEYDFTAVLLYLASIINVDSEHIEEFIKTVLNSPVFSPRFSAFDAGPEFDNINRLRSEFITVLANRAFTGLVKLLDVSLENPLIFAEVILRVICQFDQIPMELLVSRLLMRSIVNASVLFSKMHVKVGQSYSIEREVIESTRVALFNFIERILASPEMANVWFSYQVFTNFFITLMFEMPVRPFVFDKLRKYISSKNEEFSSPLISSFISTIELLLMHFPDSQHVLLAMQLLEMVNSIIQHKKSLSHLFIDLSNCVLDSLSLLECNEIGHKFFIEVLEFVKCESKMMQLTQTNKEALSESIRKMNMPNYVDEIRNKLLQIYIDTKVDENKVSGVFIYPTLFEDSLSHNRINEWIESTKKLLVSSVSNCVAFHNGEIDLFFLSFIEKHKMDKEKDPLVVSVLDLFLTICQKISSPAVIQNFINLLGPCAKQTVSVYYETFITSLNKTLVNSDPRLKSYIPIQTDKNQPTFQFQNIHFKNFDGFGFNLKLLFTCEPFTTKRINLIEFGDLKSNLFTLFIENKELFFEFNAEKIISVSQNLNPGSVSELLITIDENHIEISFNKKVVTVNHSLSFYAPFSFTVGRTKEAISEPSLLFHMFEVQSFNKQQLCFIEADTETRSVAPIYAMQNGEIRFTFSSYIENMSSIVDVIVDTFEIKSLFLLFHQMDFLDINQKKLENISVSCAELITNMFRVSQKAQQSFFDSHLTGILSHILTVCDPSNLTYALYMKLNEMMEQTSISKLRSNIMKRILVELQIWSRSTSAVLYEITSHWLNVFIPKYGSEFSSFLSVNSLLLVLQEQKDDTETTVKAMENIEKLIVEISKNQFMTKNFLLYIGQCITCTNRSHIKLFLTIMKNFLSLSHESPSKLQTIGNYISILHNLLGYNDADLFISLIELIILAHEHGVVQNLTLEQHINILMGELDHHLFTSDVLERLISLFKETKRQELIPMLAMIALNIGQKGIETLINEIDFDMQQFPSLKDLIWFVALYGNCRDISAKNKILGKKMMSKPSLIRRTCSVMNIISLAMNIDEFELIEPFLLSVIENLEQNLGSLSTETKQKTLLNIYHNIFYQVINFQSKRFEEMFIKNSPFNDDSQASTADEKESDNSLLTYKLLYRRIEFLAQNGLNMSFGLRIKDNEWQDEKIAINMIRLYEKIVDPFLLQYDFLLCCFLFRTKPEIVLNHINTLNQHNLILRLPPSIMFYFSQIVHKAGKEIQGFPMPHDPQLALNFLQEIAANAPQEAMPKQIAQWIIQSYENSCTIEKHFMSLINHGVAEGALHSIDHFISVSKTRREHCRDLWKQLYKEMVYTVGYWKLLRKFGDSENETIE